MPTPPPANTTASMIVRTATPDAQYSIYNLGQNKMLAGQVFISAPPGIGDNWDFAGPGAVNLDFGMSNTIDMFVKRPNGGNNDYQVYNISQNNVVGSKFLGSIGQNWQVAGFGYFFGLNQADMVTRSVAGATVTYNLYDTTSNQFTNFTEAARVGTDWNTAGLGTFVNDDPSIPPTGLMVLKQSGTGTMLAYAFRDGKLVNATGSLPDPTTGKTATPFGAAGQDVVGFGKFASGVPLGMITRGTDNTFRIYDIVQNLDATRAPYYVASLSNVNNGVLIPSSAGVNSNLTFVGFAPIAGNSPVEAPFTDMVLRDTNPDSTTFGTFFFYDIKDDALGPSGMLQQPPSAPIAASSTVGGMASDQLVQAMAGFGGSSGAAGGLSTAPLGADTSQQQQSFLTTPQHA
jgi:hypothetical protein